MGVVLLAVVYTIGRLNVFGVIYSPGAFHFLQFIYMLEERNLLGPDNEIDLFALHYIYLIMHFTCFKIPIVVIIYTRHNDHAVQGLENSLVC